MKLEDVYAKLKADYNLLSPTFLSVEGEIIYIAGPESLEAMHHHKLDKTMQQLIDERVLTPNEDGKAVFVMTNDKNIKSKLVLKIHLDE